MIVGWLPEASVACARAELCLVCVPHAGGMHSVYSSWQRYFGETIAMRAVAMPGRGIRLREPAMTEMPMVVQSIVQAIEALPWRSVAILGDCSGANIALALAKAVERGGRTRVVHLFAAGVPDPVRADPDPRHVLSEEAFRDWALEERLIPPTVLQDPRALNFFLPQIRADYRLVETHREDTSPLACPITTFVGAGDSLASRSFDAWNAQTTGGWRHVTLASGHRVSADPQDELKSIIVESLYERAAAHGRAAGGI